MDVRCTRMFRLRLLKFALAALTMVSVGGAPAPAGDRCGCDCGRYGGDDYYYSGYGYGGAYYLPPSYPYYYPPPPAYYVPPPYRYYLAPGYSTYYAPPIGGHAYRPYDRRVRRW